MLTTTMSSARTSLLVIWSLYCFKFQTVSSFGISIFSAPTSISTSTTKFGFIHHNSYQNSHQNSQRSIFRHNSMSLSANRKIYSIDKSSSSSFQSSRTRPSLSAKDEEQEEEMPEQDDQESLAKQEEEAKAKTEVEVDAKAQEVKDKKEEEKKKKNVKLIENDTNISTEPTTDDIMNFSELGDFDPSKKIPIKREVLVGDPQLKIKNKDISVSAILQELAAIQEQGPRKYCILGTRHCSYLHQQIIELLSYALVLSENHVYTSGAGGTNAAAIRGALRAERPDLLTVILPQSMNKQPNESQELLRDVTDLISMPQNDEMSLNVASRLCNSKLLSETDQLIAFAFHESKTVIEATKEAKKLEMLVTMLFLD